MFSVNSRYYFWCPFLETVNILKNMKVLESSRWLYLRNFLSNEKKEFASMSIRVHGKTLYRVIPIQCWFIFFKGQ